MDNGIHAAIVSLSSNRYLLLRMRQCLYDYCCAWKQAGTDAFCESLESDRLLSSHSGVNEKDVAANKFQVEMVRENV